MIIYIEILYEHTPSTRLSPSLNSRSFNSYNNNIYESL